MLTLIMKNIVIVIVLLNLIDLGYTQRYNDYDDIGEERLHHKKKKKQGYRPCRRSNDNYDEKTLAVNLYVNNYPGNGGGYGDPCPSGYPSNGGGGGHLSGILGSHGGNLLSSHPILSGLLGNFGLGGGSPGGNNPSTAIATAIAGAGSDTPNTQPESLGGGQGGNLGTILGAVAGAGSGLNDKIEDNVHEDQSDKRGPVLFSRESSIVGAYLDLFGLGGYNNRPYVSQRPNYNQYINPINANPDYGYNDYGSGYHANNYYRDPADDKNSKFLGYSNNNLNNGYRQVNKNVNRPNYRLYK